MKKALLLFKTYYEYTTNTRDNIFFTNYEVHAGGYEYRVVSLGIYIH